MSEAQPTADQLRNILEYIGDENVGKLVPGVQDRKMALEKMERDAESFRRPVVCGAAFWQAMPRIYTVFT